MVPTLYFLLAILFTIVLPFGYGFWLATFLKRQYEFRRSAMSQDQRIPSAGETVMEILRSTSISGIAPMPQVVSGTIAETPESPGAAGDPVAAVPEQDADSFAEDQDESLARAVSFFEEGKRDAVDPSESPPSHEPVDEFDFNALRENVEKLGGSPPVSQFPAPDETASEFAQSSPQSPEIEQKQEIEQETRKGEDADEEGLASELLDPGFDFDALRQTLAAADAPESAETPDAQEQEQDFQSEQPQHAEETELRQDAESPPSDQGESDSVFPGHDFDFDAIRNALESRSTSGDPEDATGSVDSDAIHPPAEESLFGEDADEAVAEDADVPEENVPDKTEREEDGKKTDETSEAERTDETDEINETDRETRDIGSSVSLRESPPAKITRETFEEMTVIETVPEEFVDSHLCDATDSGFVEVEDSLISVPEEFLLNVSVDPPSANARYTEISETLIPVPKKRKTPPSEPSSPAPP